MNIIRIPGLADYQETLRLQEQLVRAHQEDPDRENELLLLEHAGVYTIGRTRNHASLHPGSVLPFPVHEINRGGQATYHGPGQLVGYPITDLNRCGRDLHRYVTTLENTLIETCARFGVQARIREGLVGVWVENRKIASIGVGVKKWIAMHGCLQRDPRSCPLPGNHSVRHPGRENDLPEDEMPPPCRKETCWMFRRRFCSAVGRKI
ncbi:MAG: lipoyl(octanoyl) transferase LipB [Akkermansia sp.]